MKTLDNPFSKYMFYGYFVLLEDVTCSTVKQNTEQTEEKSLVHLISQMVVKLNQWRLYKPV